MRAAEQRRADLHNYVAVSGAAIQARIIAIILYRETRMKCNEGCLNGGAAHSWPRQVRRALPARGGAGEGVDL